MCKNCSSEGVQYCREATCSKRNLVDASVRRVVHFTNHYWPYHRSLRNNTSFEISCVCFKKICRYIFANKNKLNFCGNAVSGMLMWIYLFMMVQVGFFFFFITSKKDCVKISKKKNPRLIIGLVFSANIDSTNR